MEYNNDVVRRQDRLLDEASAVRLLSEAEWGVMSMTDEDGAPYGLPVNYVWDGNHSLYIHCAPEGRKLRCLDHDNRVSFTVVGRVNLLPAKFTTEYESLVLAGSVVRHLDDDEKRYALELLLDKLSPNDKEIGMKYAVSSFHRVEILRLDISTWSGKRKHVPVAD